MPKRDGLREALFRRIKRLIQTHGLDWGGSAVKLFPAHQITDSGPASAIVHTVIDGEHRWFEIRVKELRK